MTEDGSETDMASEDAAEEGMTTEGAVESEMAEDATDTPMGDEGMNSETASETSMEEGSSDMEMAEGANSDADNAPANEDEGLWTAEMDENLNGISGNTVADLVGMDVTGSEGSDVGEIDYLGVQNDDTLVAIIGIGGFLGLGEHSVAVPFDRFSFEQDELVLSGMTEDELRDQPEYDENSVNVLDEDRQLDQLDM